MIKRAVSGHTVMESLFRGADRLLPRSRRLERSDKPKRTEELLQIAGCDSPPHKSSHYKPTWPDISMRFWAERIKKYFSEKHIISTNSSLCFLTAML